MLTKAKELYRAGFVEDKGREVKVLQKAPQELTIIVTGFDKKLEFLVTGQGVSLCRTIIEHRSDGAQVTLSLPIPDPRGRCRMLPGTLSIQSKSPPISMEEAPIERLAGADQQLRKIIFKRYGEIEG